MTESRPGTEERLADALSEYIDLLNSRKAPSVDRFLARYADLAAELRPMLEAAIVVGEETAAFVLQPVTEEAFAAIQRRLQQEPRLDEMPQRVEEGIPPMPVTQRPDYLILLVNAMEELWGVTRAVKMLLLLGDEGGASRFVPDYYAHTADNFGPFDKTVYRDIEGLQRAGILEAARPRGKGQQSADEVDLRAGAKSVEAVYRLTPKGKLVARALTVGARNADPAILTGVREVATKYGNLPLEDLVRIVYLRYPQHTTKSKIRRRILGEDE